jgi:hypothetical protein
MRENTMINSRAKISERCGGKPKLGLGPAESFVDNFFWPRWRFEIGVFDPVIIRRG